MTRRTKNLKIVDEDILLVHPNDAKSRELNSGDIARLYSGRGEVSLKVEVTDKVKEGIVSQLSTSLNIWLIWLLVTEKMKKPNVQNTRYLQSMFKRYQINLKLK